ncbi:MAG: dihydrofolate reductase family protein [Gammaproteobacteria bacterium]
MAARVLQLYPQPGGERPLAGLYLGERLHELGKPGAPFVYGNFLQSLDGRIALIDNGESQVPKALASASDWLLFQELQAQADCFITHGGYLRALARGILGNVLQVGTRTDNGHLLAWRYAQGWRQQPAVVILSASLDFPMPESLREHGQTVIIATGATAAEEKVLRWREQGYEVVRLGREAIVAAQPLVEWLGARGFRSIYLLAGPLLLETMLRQGKLGRLYLTFSHQFLGGAAFHTLIPGAYENGEASALNLRTLYFEPPSARPGQFFACFTPRDESKPTGP